VAVPGFAQKPKITRQDELPRHSYPVERPASELIQSKEAFAPIAARLRRDVLADLEGFDVEDKTTLKSMHHVLLQVNLIEGRFEDAMTEVAVLRELEDKPGVKRTTGLDTEALARGAGDVASGEAVSLREATDRHYRELVAALPWSEVQDVLESTKGSLEMASPNLSRLQVRRAGRCGGRRPRSRFLGA
jgi:hypothetical protein